MNITMPTAAEVEKILRWPLSDGRQWTVQGFGMLRTYLGGDTEDQYRLNVWDDRFQVPGFSDIHDHPWHFTSMIYAGYLDNAKFERVPSQAGRPYNQVRIRPGKQGGPIRDPKQVALSMTSVAVYQRGETYFQQAEELHRTGYLRGTVTVICRDRVVQDDTAYSLWAGDGPWVSAEPRDATSLEVLDIIGYSLKRWWD